MRKLLLTLAAVSVSMCGCRLFRDDDRSSRRYYGPPVVIESPAPPPAQGVLIGR